MDPRRRHDEHCPPCLERDGLNAGMGAKEIATLIESDRMREHAPDVLQLNPGCSDQVVANAEMKLGVDKHLAREQQVEVFGHRAGQRVLDRDYCCLYRALSNRSKTSEDRAHGTTTARGSILPAASWLKQPSSPGSRLSFGWAEHTRSDEGLRRVAQRQ